MLRNTSLAFLFAMSMAGQAFAGDIDLTRVPSDTAPIEERQDWCNLFIEQHHRPAYDDTRPLNDEVPAEGQPTNGQQARTNDFQACVFAPGDFVSSLEEDDAQR